MIRILKSKEKIELVKEVFMIDEKVLMKLKHLVGLEYNKEVINSKYRWFQTNFGKEFLIKNNFKKEELLIHLFGNKEISNGMSLKYILERDSGFNTFGSIKGTYDFNYPIRFSSATYSWKISQCSAQTEKEVLIDEAIKELEVVIGEFLDIFKKVESLIPFSEVSKYSELDVFIKYKHKRLYNKMWFIKYLHMLYPQYFSNFYNNGSGTDWLPVLVSNLPIYKISNSKIICNGQIAAYSKKFNTNMYDFSLMLYEYCKDHSDFVNPLYTDNARRISFLNKHKGKKYE
ncbi:MAG: hypothetical protein PHY08_09645 [Candidatus Cloacimonetes bacterium]|nr:hypothetical protein [Candidatus Cloacimonadota bacterium]